MNVTNEPLTVEEGGGCKLIGGPALRSHSENFEANLGEPLSTEPEEICGSLGYVDDAVFDKGTSVIDPQNQASSIFQICYPNLGAERQRRVGSGPGAIVEDLTVRCLPVLKCRGVVGGHSNIRLLHYAGYSAIRQIARGASASGEEQQNDKSLEKFH